MKKLILVFLLLQGVFCAYPGGIKNYTYSVSIKPLEYQTFDYSIDSDFIQFSLQSNQQMNVYIFNNTELQKFLSVPQKPYEGLFSQLKVNRASAAFNVTVGNDYWTLLVQNPGASQANVNITHVFNTVIDIDWNLTYGLTISIPIILILLILLCVLINAIYLFIASFFQKKEDVI